MKTKSKKKRDIVYGNVKIDLKNVQKHEFKMRVTTYIDLDVLEALKEQAKQMGMGYQTYLNSYLREKILKEAGVLTRLDRIEKAISGKSA